MFHSKRVIGPLSLACLSVTMAMAAQAADKDAPPTILDTMKVIGDPGKVRDLPGSAQYLDTGDIRDQNYSDINRILRKVPGVNIREEDGFGLFPNISFRGVDTTRSAKITIMEDGVLTAPAPYSAPAAYFSPAGGRMSGVEVMKGGSQVKYGPHITGGVLNYLSTPIPEDGKAYLKTTYGSYNGVQSHGYVGNTHDTEFGRFGYLVEGFYRRSDGFKTIESTAGFGGSDRTGFSQVEPMIRLMWEPKTEMYQRLEVKFGYSNMEADETYLGLSETDFKKHPFRRYAASRFDNITTEHFRGFARYFISPTDDLDIVTTAYYSEFARNWRKLEDIRARPGGLAGNIGLSQALAGAASNGGFAGDGLACLKGQLACGLRVRDNNREYYLGGVESVANYRFDLGDTHHEMSGGFRYHEDGEKRFQHQITHFQDASGAIIGNNFGAPDTLPGGQDDRRQETRAVAFFLKDRIEFGNWGFTPGIRYEHLSQENKNFQKPTQDGTSSLDLYAGGASLDYTFNEDLMVFGSIHRGFSPPGPQNAVVDGLTEETSNAYELGVRYSKGAFSAEVIGFYTQFENLLVIDSIGGTGSDDNENFGEVDSRGVEVALNFDAGQAFGLGFRNPYFVSFTYTDTVQLNDAASSDPESIFSFGKKGNRMPYIPEYAVSFGSGIHFDKWGVDVTGNYVGETFTSASNTSQQLDGNGNPDSRFGKTDDYVVVDVAAYYQVTKEIKLLGGVQNANNEKYNASRQPHGPRPGMPIFAYGGFELDFDI
ncbi:MAG: TonB-dependent receptor [Methylomicrobium sp.]|nr:TonB-dependent receptor [Methylomicrobium sp.]